MKASLFRAPGGPEALSYEDAPDPVPGPGEALVEVKACGVNRIDIWLRSGRYKTSLPHILGSDIAGVVSPSGPWVPGFSAGTKVLIYPVLSDGTCPYCLKGMTNRCVSRGLVGSASDGGYAQLVKVPAANLVSFDGLDFGTAAALPVNFATAWNGLSSRARVGPDDTVLVWGAAGGVGYAAVQIAKFLGAKVIAAVGSSDKAGFVRSLGADYVVDYGKEDVVERVRAITGDLGASVVLDHIGGDTWTKSIDSLARGGRMITLGLTSGPRSDVDVRRIYQDELSIMGTYAHRKEDLLMVLDLAAEGKIKPSLAKELPLQSARESHELLESRKVNGKVVLIP